ncbi:MAG TPA: prepilin-type N-terminal cleavage/methylation domain-containing protein [Verrucomicrobiaceae bacterium]|jgi:prepilin-type N-terminal cleavage/methylation domain-containing protein
MVTHHSSPITHHSPAFTLIELVVVLTILAVMVAAAVPSFRGLQDEQVAREPVAALARLAKEARLHAIGEKRPYQIVFADGGFSATRYLSPYLQAAELDKFLQQVQIDTQNADAQAQAQGDAPPPAPVSPDQVSAPQAVFKEWTEHYTLPAGTTYTVQFWHEAEPTAIGGDLVKLWVFQPSGICEPVTVRFDHEKAAFEAGFNALTADLISEKSELK